MNVADFEFVSKDTYILVRLVTGDALLDENPF